MNNIITKPKRWEYYYQVKTPKLCEKNGIELLVEIRKFINETKFFKYWSIKKSNKEKMLDELTKCLI